MDYLTKKKKANEGEIPQYYIEHSHEAIIDPDEWDAVQVEIKRRKALGNAYSGKSVISAKLVCGDCGALYGPKTWHSKDEYRSEIWRWNRKYEKSKPRCCTPHVTEEDVKARFLRAYNRMITNKSPYLEACALAKHVLTDTVKIDQEAAELLQEIEVVSELIRKCIAVNSSQAQNQDEYNARYNAYVDRQENAQRRYDALMEKRTARIAQRKAIDRFIRELSSREDLLTVFDNRLWLVLVESVTVFRDGTLIFHFYDGTEVSEDPINS